MISNLSDKSDRDMYLQFLKDSDITIRLEAIDILGNLAEELAVEPLVEKLNSSHWMEREHAAVALAKIGNSGPLALMKILYDVRGFDPSRKAAKAGLKNLKNKAVLEPYSAQLKHSDFETRTKAARVLSYCGNLGLEILISSLGNPDTNVRDAAVYGLMVTQDSKEVVTEPLISTLLHDPESRIRGHAANALRLAGDERSYKPLMVALQTDPAPRVRYHAIRALYEGGAADESEELFRQALTDEDAEVREQAAAFVGEPGNYEVFEALVKLMDDSEEDVRMAAAYSLGEIGDSRAIEVLLKYTTDKSEYVRHNILRALGKHKASKALPILRQIANSDSYGLVRKAASEAVNVIENASK